jgi:hypothetical protein
MDVAVEIAAEPMHECHGAEAGVRRRAGAALPECGLDRAQEDRQKAADHLRLVPQVPPDALGHRQHPLPVPHARQHLVDHIGRDVDHAARGARRAQVAPLHEKVTMKSVRQLPQ